MIDTKQDPRQLYINFHNINLRGSDLRRTGCDPSGDVVIILEDLNCFMSRYRMAKVIRYPIAENNEPFYILYNDNDVVVQADLYESDLREKCKERRFL